MIEKKLYSTLPHQTSLSLLDSYSLDIWINGHTFILFCKESKQLELLIN